MFFNPYCKKSSPCPDIRARRTYRTPQPFDRSMRWKIMLSTCIACPDGTTYKDNHTMDYESFVGTELRGITWPNLHHRRLSICLPGGKLTFDERVVVHRVNGERSWSKSSDSFTSDTPDVSSSWSRYLWKIGEDVTRSLLSSQPSTLTNTRCGSSTEQALVQCFFDIMYLSFRESTYPRNRQLHILFSNSEQ